MYSNSNDNMHMEYNHVIAITNYYPIQQEMCQSLQEYHDLFMAYRKVCEQLGLKVGTSENGGSNMLKRMKNDNLTRSRKEGY